MICIGYVSFKIVAPKPAGKSTAVVKKSEAKPAAEDSEAANSPASAVVTTETASAGIFPDLNSVPARRDPFLPQALPGVEDDTSNVRAAAMVQKPRPPDTYPISKVPQISIAPANPFSLGTAPTAVHQPDEETERDPEFVLTGVIRGDENVAIIRSGGSGRHVVRQGQLIDGHYRVQSITDDGVVLVYKNRRIHVRLGGAKNAS